MNIQETIEVIRWLPSGAIYSDNDALDPMAVFPTLLNAADLKSLAAHVQRLEDALQALSAKTWLKPMTRQQFAKQALDKSPEKTL